MKKLLLVVSALSLAAPAAAYEFLQCGWRITGWYNNGCPAGSKDSDSCGCGVSAAPKWYGARLSMKVENEGGNGITAQQFVQAGREAAQAWSNVSCSSFMFDASQTLAQNSSARWGDYNNLEDEHGVFWVATESEWQRVTGSGAGGTLGVTVSPYSYGCTGRTFFDTDILINGFLYEGWSYNSVKSVTMHEMGHSLGLGHPCLMGVLTGQCSGECQALMGATGGEYTTPQQDDVNGICQLYPGTPGGLGASCTSGSQCQSAPICITYEGFSYCTHTCGTCEEGYECKQVDAQNVCVRKGAPAAGDVCTGVCAPGAVCVVDGGTEQAPIAHCYVSCTPPSTAGCPTDYRCVELDGGGGICWPPGTQQLGEQCGTQATGDCATGLICLGDEGTEPNVIAHCYRECDETRPTSCGTGYLCYDIGESTGVCLRAASANQPCEPPAADYVCESGWECTPPPDGSDTYICNRACTINQEDSCGEGETCVTFVNASNQPVAAACYPEGDKTEGEVCSTGLDCAQGLLCVTVSSTRAECLVECNPSAPSCPHAGQTCEGLSGGSGICWPAGGSATTDGGTGVDRASGSDGGTVNPDGRDYLEACTQDSECKYNLCRGVAGHGSICLQPCDPRLGHYDCPTVEDSGCVPEDVTALNFGGTCQPDVAGEASLGVGQTCAVNNGYRTCSSGLCESDTCLMVCNGGSCPDGFECDLSEIEDPGVCRPLKQAPLCGCATTGDEALALTPLWLGLALLAARRRRG